MKIVPKVNNEVQQVVKVLKDFKTIKNIKKGSEVASYKFLGISVTPKVHAVLDHIEVFFVHQNDGLGVGITLNRPQRPFTDFSKHWTVAGYKREMINKEYSNNLKCVVYNSRHK